MKGINIMEKITKERLLKAGWTETRRVNITNIENKYCEAKVNLPDNVKNFLSEYGYLVFDDKDRREDVEFIPEKAIGYELDKEYFEELLEEYDINEVVYPVGMISQGNLMIVMTTENIFYCFMDGYLEKAGNCVEDMLDCLVGECRKGEVIE